LHIRCGRCATVYELDERILPPAGAPVQCTRCQHVFQAFPPQAAARTLAGPPPPGPSAAPGGSPAPRRDPRNDTLANFAAQVRRQSLWKWLGPLLLAMAVAGGYGAWAWRSRQVDPAALSSREEGAALLARDDTSSLEKAAAAFAQASRIAPRLVGARADGALARILLASGLRDDAAALEARFKSLDGERSRLEAERPAGWDRRRAEVIERMRPAKAALDALREKARALQDEAYAELRGLAREHAADPAVERALAVYYAFDGNAEQGGKLVRNARASRQADAWVDLAEAAADALGANARNKREQAVARLGPLAAAHPELLRARMLLAAAQVDLGRRDAAVATLDSVLAANPGHDRAQRMKAGLLEAR
jgi:predicted Zn finger-like uncharacterized protein